MSPERLLSVEEARDTVLAGAGGPLEAECLALDEALGRVAAEPVRARISLPPWPNSAMDGYAIIAADVAGATESAPVRLSVTGETAAGGEGTAPVQHGVAVRIATGAPLPDGADAIVQVELTTPIAADGTAGRLIVRSVGCSDTRMSASALTSWWHTPR